MGLKNFLFFSFLWISGEALAQVDLRIYYSESPKIEIGNKIIPDSLGWREELTQFLLQRGYFTPQIDSIKSNSLGDSLRVWIRLGNRWKAIRLRTWQIDATPLEFNSQIHSEDSFRILDFTEWDELKTSYFNNKENSGFPFASIELKNCFLDSTNITCDVNGFNGPLVLIDSMVLAGTSELKPRFLNRFLGLKKGTKFSKVKLDFAESKLARLPYLQQLRPYGLYFYGNLAKPYFYYNKKNASSFDGFLGLAPNSSINGKLVLTGDINLKLQNLLATGKSLEVNFRSFRAGSTDLKVKFEEPALFNTGFGFSGKFGLLKFDSIYLELQTELGLNQMLNKHLDWGFIYRWKRVDLLNPDTSLIRVSRQLPEFSDFSINQLSIRLQKLRPIARNSVSTYWEMETELGLGLRNLIRNPLIASMQFQSEQGKWISIYDGIPAQSSRFDGAFQLVFQKKVATNWVWVNQLSVAALLAQKLFLNELFRIGGLKTLRGFDEQSIFADKYATGLSEIRYRFGQESYFCAFYNHAMYTRITSNDKVLQASGFGFGMQAETGSGKLVLYYALGSNNKAGFDLNAARIHFGYTSLF